MKPLCPQFPWRTQDQRYQLRLLATRDGIYVGYRYFNSFHVQPAFPFGYGLSYTKFKYSNLKLSSNRFKGQLTAKVTVTNTGSQPGKEIIQLYLSAPYKNMYKPAEELKGFAKTMLLKPGASQTLTFSVKAADLASFDNALNHPAR